MKSLVTKQSITPNNTSQTTETQTKETHLEARWIKVDGKLVCRWVTIEE
ncbi:MAG: hypothetical protein QNJ54_13595 [Prochloraceae cyanobacterium]|nr:hypothetical protein [Prochloraceae cyanobacterium]